MQKKRKNRQKIAEIIKKYQKKGKDWYLTQIKKQQINNITDMGKIIIFTFQKWKKFILTLLVVLICASILKNGF